MWDNLFICMMLCLNLHVMCHLIFNIICWSWAKLIELVWLITTLFGWTWSFLTTLYSNNKYHMSHLSYRSICSCEYCASFCTRGQFFCFIIQIFNAPVMGSVHPFQMTDLLALGLFYLPNTSILSTCRIIYKVSQFFLLL